LKAITISEPWASKIASGEKWVENRIWPTKYRGEIAIHAGGCVIAIANLTACVKNDQVKDIGATLKGFDLIDGSSLNWVDVAEHKYTEGPWCWILEDVRRIKPIPAKGLQRIWNWFPVQRIKMHD